MSRMSIANALAYRDKRLSPCDLLVLGVLGIYADSRTFYCYPSQGKIAAWLGVSRKAVNRSICVLVETGWLLKRRRYRPNGSETSCAYKVLYDHMLPTEHDRAPNVGKTEDDDEGDFLWEDEIAAEKSGGATPGGNAPCNPAVTRGVPHGGNTPCDPGVTPLTPKKERLREKKTLCRISPEVAPSDVSIGKRMAEIWNELCGGRDRLRPIARMPDSRCKKFASRLRAEFGGSLDEFRAYCRRIAESDFLSGRKSDWSADVEWVLNAGNAAKIIEGKYDNRTHTPPARTNDPSASQASTANGLGDGDRARLTDAWNGATPWEPWMERHGLTKAESRKALDARLAACKAGEASWPVKPLDRFLADDAYWPFPIPGRTPRAAEATRKRALQGECGTNAPPLPAEPSPAAPRDSAGRDRDSGLHARETGFGDLFGDD